MDPLDGGGTSAHTAGGASTSIEPEPSNRSNDNLPPQRPVCEWRTAAFHDQECLKFFDCPTHIVARQLSDDEDENEDREGGEDEDEDEDEDDIRAAHRQQEQETEDEQGDEGLRHEEDSLRMEELRAQPESGQPSPTPRQESQASLDASAMSSDSGSLGSTSGSELNSDGMDGQMPVQGSVDDGLGTPPEGPQDNPTVLEDSPVEDLRRTMDLSLRRNTVDGHDESHLEDEPVGRSYPNSPGDYLVSAPGTTQPLPTVPIAALSSRDVSSASPASPEHEMPPSSLGTHRRPTQRRLCCRDGSLIVK